MTKATTKSREVSKKNSQDSFSGLSILRLSGFRICQVVKEKSPKNSLSERKILKELLCPKEKK